MSGREQPAEVADLGERTILHADFGPYATGSTTYASSSPAAAHTEVIEIPPAVPDLSWMPDTRPGDPAVPELRRPRDRGRGRLRGLVNAAALGVIIVAVFVGGQWSVENGTRPVVPFPEPTGIETAAGLTRVWQLGTPGEHKQHCRWLAAPGETREYVLREWVAYLRSEDGGALAEVDPAVVARVLDDACAGRRP